MTKPTVQALALCLLFAGIALAAGDPLLVGTWEGTSDNALGETIRIQANGTASTAGQSVRWSVPSKGVLQLEFGGEAASAQYAVDRTTLIIVLAEERYAYRRTSKPPSSGGAPGPAPAGADRFARTFTGDGVTLSLKKAGDGYKGTLVFGESTNHVKATVQGESVSGSFGLGFPFKGTLTGAKTMTLIAAGKTYSLTATGAAPAGGGAGEARGGKAPPSLEGVYRGAASRYEHPRKWYSFDMPSGWSVWKESEEGLVVNPGFTEADSLDALITVEHGMLEDAEKNAAINDLVDQYTPQLRQGLASQGINLDPPKTKATKVLIGEVPGAVQVFTGTTSQGAKITIWFGALIKREYYLSVTAMIVDGKESKFLPGVKRIFASLRPTPPQLNTKVMAALAGRKFAKNSTTESGSFSVIYTFYEGGAVKSESLFSGGPVGGSSEESGRYEVMGMQVFLYFKDGQQSGTVVIKDGQIAGLQFGSSLYHPY